MNGRSATDRDGLGTGLEYGYRTAASHQRIDSQLTDVSQTHDDQRAARRSVGEEAATHACTGNWQRAAIAAPYLPAPPASCSAATSADTGWAPCSTCPAIRKCGTPSMPMREPAWASART